MNKRILKLALTGIFGFLSVLLAMYLHTEGYISTVVMYFSVLILFGGSMSAMGKM